jgi:hypothetical protein
MRKIIGGFAFAVIITSAWGDATETVTGNSAVEFVLSTCLPAMDDVTNVEAMAREKNWPQLPTMGYGSEKYTTPHLRWRANGYQVVTWIFKERNNPSCFVGIGPYKRVDRNEFFQSISAALQLELTSDKTFTGFRQEMFRIVGERPLNLLFSSIGDGTVSSVSIYMEPQTEQAH